MKTQLLCRACLKDNYSISKGTETPKRLLCKNCKDYAYTIFGVLCIREADFSEDATAPKPLTYEQVRKALEVEA